MSAQSLSLPSVVDLASFVEAVRVEATATLASESRAKLGQFFTPLPVAQMMASLSHPKSSGTVRLLDAGAGVGVLSAAWIARVCQLERRPSRIAITAFEIDKGLLPRLERVLKHCQFFAESHEIELGFEILDEDFIRAANERLNGGLFGEDWARFDATILNPPYAKLNTDSDERRLLRELGVETSNLYSGFVSLALRTLAPGGELVAITPRSFCNGPYFTPFRKDLLRLGSLTHVHVFDSRSEAFGDSSVLQENVVFRVERGVEQSATVQIEWSSSGNLEDTVRREVTFSEVVRSGDPDSFIHIAADEWDTRIANIVGILPSRLEDLGIQVSTGRVVDFRIRHALRQDPGPNTVPLIYPGHFDEGKVRWPRPGFKKPNAVWRDASVESQLNPTGTYVLVKRFSSKEERRRVVAVVFTPDAAPGEFVAFENHINYFHRRGVGLPGKLARGLAAYLNSTLLDSYFRQFSGHTQVNATDLRKLPYPTVAQLERIADQLTDSLDQTELDEVVEGELIELPTKPRGNKKTQRRIEEACEILKALGLPKQQTNERAGLTLLALLDLTPKHAWADAQQPLRGVTPMMEFAAEFYGKQWKPNTRETVRRFTLHQFRDAGLVVANPDRPDRAVNSPDYCYQVTDPALELVRAYGTDEWDDVLREYLASAQTLSAKYAHERKMARIPLRVREDLEITLSPGGQNELIRQIVEEFCPRFTPGAKALYIGDADKKWGYFDHDALKSLGVEVDQHGKMPDVVVHFTEKNWLILVEAVTSHGPVDSKRRLELRALFENSTAPLVYVTAFLDRQSLSKYISAIAWETEVWAADNPTHMIHFNGERFLGPYD